METIQWYEVEVLTSASSTPSWMYGSTTWPAYTTKVTASPITLNITALPFLTYELRISAANVGGTGPTAVFTAAPSPESIPSGVPRNVTLAATYSNATEPGGDAVVKQLVVNFLVPTGLWMENTPITGFQVFFIRESVFSQYAFTVDHQDWHSADHEIEVVLNLNSAVSAVKVCSLGANATCGPLSEEAVVPPPPTTTTTTTTTKATSIVSFIDGVTRSSHGGVLAPNGLIYTCPQEGTALLIIDPATNTIDETTITGLPGGSFMWAEPVLVNDTVYCMPCKHDAVLKIDTTTSVADYTTITGAGNAAFKFRGSVLANNGKIFGIPYHDTRVAIIDPNANTMDLTTITGLIGGGDNSYSWRGGVKAEDGRIFGVPYYADCVLIIDPATEAADETSLCLSPTDNRWAGAALSSNGIIYMMPFNAGHVIILDPATDTLDTTSISGLVVSDNAYVSAVAVGSTVLAIPYVERDVMVIDTNTASATFVPTFASSSDQWGDGVLASNSKIYCTSETAGSVLVFDTKALTSTTTTTTTTATTTTARTTTTTTTTTTTITTTTTMTTTRTTTTTRTVTTSLGCECAQEEKDGMVWPAVVGCGALSKVQCPLTSRNLRATRMCLVGNRFGPIDSSACVNDALQELTQAPVTSTSAETVAASLRTATASSPLLGARDVTTTVTLIASIGEVVNATLGEAAVRNITTQLTGTISSILSLDDTTLATADANIQEVSK